VCVSTCVCAHVCAHVGVGVCVGVRVRVCVRVCLNVILSLNESRQNEMNHVKMAVELTIACVQLRHFLDECLCRYRRAVAEPGR